MSRGRLRTSTHVRQLPRPRASGGLHANPPPAPVRSPGNQPVLRRRGPERCGWRASPAKPRTTRLAFRRRRSREPAPINQLAAAGPDRLQPRPNRRPTPPSSTNNAPRLPRTSPARPSLNLLGAIRTRRRLGPALRCDSRAAVKPHHRHPKSADFRAARNQPGRSRSAQRPARHRRRRRPALATPSRLGRSGCSDASARRPRPRPPARRPPNPAPSAPSPPRRPRPSPRPQPNRLNRRPSRSRPRRPAPRCPPPRRPPRRRLRRKRAQLWLPPTRDRGSSAARCPASVASARRPRRASLAAGPPTHRRPATSPTPKRRCGRRRRPRLGRSIARAATGGEVVNARPSDSIAPGAGRAPQPGRASPRGRDPSPIQPSRPHLDRAAHELDPDPAAGARAGSTTPARPPARKAGDARIGAAARPGARAGAARLGGAARLAAAPRADPAAALARRSPRHPNELRQPPDPASPEHRAPSGGAPDGSPPQAGPGPGRADPACSETSSLAGTVAATDDRNRAPSREPRTASRPRSHASVNPAGCRGASPIGSSAVALHGLPDDGRRDAPGQRRFDTRAAAVDGRRILGIGRRGCDFVRCGWGVVGSGVVGRRRTGRRFGLRPDVPRASAPPAGRTGTTWAGRR